MAILVVDDSTTIRRIIKRSVVEEIKMDVLEVANGAQGLELLGKEADNIQLILLDWNMPGMRGLDVLKTIRADDRFKGIKIIMLTPEADSGAHEEALRSGAQNYLTKPFDAEMLVSKIRETLALQGKSET